MKKIGFLSFGHWSSSPGSQTRSASDALLQSIELAVAAEELGADGAYFRVHHFARQLGSPFPLLAAVGARTSRIEIGTAVIDMRYENPLYMAENTGAADLIAGGRLQLGISRGSPEQVIDGFRYFGYEPPEGQTDADMARDARPGPAPGAARRGLRPAQSAPDVPQPARPAAGRAVLSRAAGAHLVGCRLPGDRHLGGRAGPEPAEFDADHQRVGQAVSRAAGRADPGLPGRVAEAGHEREPRVSVSRSIFALVDDRDRAYFGSADRTRTRSGSSTRRLRPSSGAPTRPSRTC